MKILKIIRISIIAYKKHLEEEIKTFNSTREREEGTLGCLLHQSTKYYNNEFLFVGSTILGTFNEFWLAGSLIWVSKRFRNCFYIMCNFVYYNQGCTMYIHLSSLRYLVRSFISFIHKVYFFYGHTPDLAVKGKL